MIYLVYVTGYEDSLDKSDVFSQMSEESEESDLDTPSVRLSPLPHKPVLNPAQISPFLDLTYWKM